MKGLFWAIGAFALAVGISIVLRANDGYALLVLPPYRVEMSLALLAVFWREVSLSSMGWCGR